MTPNELIKQLQELPEEVMDIDIFCVVQEEEIKDSFTVNCVNISTGTWVPNDVAEEEYLIPNMIFIKE